MISIHAPRTGSDARWQKASCPKRDFNPRSPHGERPAATCTWRGAAYFNPRSPHGERPFRSTSPPQSAEFQSTLPARGAT